MGLEKKDGRSTGPISPIADSSPIRLKTSLLGEDAQDGSSDRVGMQITLCLYQS